MMAQNPFLDPDREIQQGKTEEEILEEHERRQRQAADDASNYRPGPGSVDEVVEGAGGGTADGAGTDDGDILKYDGLNEWIDETVEEAMKKALEKRIEDNEKWSDKLKKWWGKEGKKMPYEKPEREKGEYGPYVEGQ